MEKNKDKKSYPGIGMVIGVGCGLSIGIALGAGMDNIGAGIAIGVALGGGIGLLIENLYSTKAKK